MLRPRRSGEAPQPAARRRPAGRAREPPPVERRVLKLIRQTTAGTGGGHDEPFFKALKARKKHDDAVAIAPSYDGYQVGEKMQNPPQKFPTTLASFVLVFETDMEWRGFDKEEGDTEPAELQGPSYAKLTMQPILDKLRSADMIVREVMSTDKMRVYALISVSEKRQRNVAEIMGNRARVRMRQQDDEENEVKNGGAWCAFRNDLFQYYEKSTEGPLFSSCQQQSIIEFLINERDPRAMGPQCIQRESCEPGNSILQQMQNDERIVTYFNLHHPEKREWLLKNWAGNFTLKQPLEDVREYFGEQIAFFFTFCGFIVTQLWVLAAVGIFCFAMAMSAVAESGDAENPYMPLFAIYVSVWSINFSAGWKRMQIVVQHEWDLLEYEDPAEDRTEFVQNTKTYKRLNEVSKREEYYPDPLWRIIALVATFFVVSILTVFTIAVAILCEVLKKTVASSLPIPPAVVLVLGANLQAALILLFRWLAKIVFTELTNYENWKTEAQYEDAFITKNYSYAFCNAYFPIIFVAFIANSVQPFGADVSCGNTCADYLILLVGIIYLQNVIVRAVTNILFSPSAPDSAEESDDLDAAVASPAEQEHKLKQFEGLTEEYMEKIIELGYIMMFAAASPLLGVIALVNNIWDLRATANKFLVTYQRPPYSCCADIGTWSSIIDITAVMSIIVNSSLLAFTSNTLFYYFPHMNEWDRVFIAVATEHLLLFLKAMMDLWVEVPEDVELAYKKKKYEESVLVERYDDKDPEEDVAFYTGQDGPLYYPEKKTPQVTGSD